MLMLPIWGPHLENTVSPSPWEHCFPITLQEHSGTEFTHLWKVRYPAPDPNQASQLWIHDYSPSQTFICTQIAWGSFEKAGYYSIGLRYGPKSAFLASAQEKNNVLEQEANWG